MDGDATVAVSQDKSECCRVSIFTARINQTSCSGLLLNSNVGSPFWLFTALKTESNIRVGEFDVKIKLYSV